MKPFLIFQIREIPEVAENEYRAILKYGKLSEEEVLRVDLSRGVFPEVDFQDFSGIIIGGGASNVSDVAAVKSSRQKAYEAYLVHLMDRVVVADFPYLGACYGLGILGLQQGVYVGTEKYGEKAGAATLFVTEEGFKDKLLHGFPDSFRSFLGHKESWQTCPANATLLVRSDDCPVHMVRIGKHVYATQFHPELDFEGVKIRAEQYKDYGYFRPDEVQAIVAAAQKENIIYPMKILERFVAYYRR